MLLLMHASGKEPERRKEIRALQPISHQAASGAGGERCCQAHWWVSKWLPEVLPTVHGLVPELALDAKQLVVLAEALRAARRAGLDLSSLEPHRKIRNVGVLRLTAPVRCHHTPART